MRRRDLNPEIRTDCRFIIHGKGDAGIESSIDVTGYGGERMKVQADGIAEICGNCAKQKGPGKPEPF
ncbi:MAG TPA: hypothetical protein VN367_04395 [Chlorobaculum sp.]|nr:hypothetical protein [Chlorobaculum sp.]